MTIKTTTWHRLEPDVRHEDPTLGIRAAVHDPLWLLGRQWQVGEMGGEDAASPVAVRIASVEHPLTRFKPANGEARDYEAATMPLETMVEREPAGEPTLRERLDAWTRLLALLAEAGLSDRAAALADAHPLPEEADAKDPAERRLLALAGAEAGDGTKVAAALRSDSAGLPSALVESYLAWFDAQRPADAGDCWVRERLEYRFAIGAPTADGEVAFEAPEYLGGRLDWYHLDLGDAGALGLGAGQAAAEEKVQFLLPQPVRFPGAPAERFWEFEDAAVDLGAVSAAAEDLGRLITVEFASAFGNDWYSAPIRARYGSLVGVRSVVVSDTFGKQYAIERPAVEPPPAAAWRVFALSDPELGAGAGPSSGYLLLAPVLAGATDGEAIEELLLLRDEMANLGWAVERVVEGGDGRPRNRAFEYASSVSAAAQESPDSPAPLIYRLQTEVPDHWIPLVPTKSASGETVLTRGTLLMQDGSRRPITALGRLLEPTVSPWSLHQEEVPRAGLRIARIPATARWTNGTAMAWIARRIGPGGGEGSSGLSFDLAAKAAEK